MLNNKLKILCNFSVIISTICGLSMSLSAETRTLFDGKTLDGWEGDSRFWSVQDGAITAKSSLAVPCDKTTYLVYTAREFANFELTASFRFLTLKGNGGIQYRSQWDKKKLYQVRGYQADMEAGKKYSGILYDQSRRGIVALRGQKVSIDSTGKKVINLEPLTDAEKAQESIKHGEWNTYRVVANGSKLLHQINGFTTIEVEDNEENRSDAKGMFALQIHEGPPMTVQYKDILVQELEASATKAINSETKLIKKCDTK